MGYTGTIILGKHTKYSEWKSDGTTNCLKYAQNYLIKKECPLSVNALDKAISKLHDEIGGYGWMSYHLINLFQSAKDLNKLRDAENLFKEDGSCDCFALLQCNGWGGIELNFYPTGTEVNAPVSEAIYHKKELSNEEVREICKKRIGCIDAKPLFYVGDAYPGLMKEVMDIKGKDSILKIIHKIHEICNQLHTDYNKDFARVEAVDEVLGHAKKKVLSGIKASVMHDGTKLHIMYQDGSEDTLDGLENYMYNLFLENNGYILSASICLTSREEFEEFIDSFETVKKRSTEFEERVMHIFEEYEDGTEFLVAGSF